MHHVLWQTYNTSLSVALESLHLIDTYSNNHYDMHCASKQAAAWQGLITGVVNVVSCKRVFCMVGGFTCTLYSGASGLYRIVSVDNTRVAGQHVQEGNDDKEMHNIAIDGKAKHLKVLALALPASCSPASGTTGTGGRFRL